MLETSGWRDWDRQPRGGLTAALAQPPRDQHGQCLLHSRPFPALGFTAGFLTAELTLAVLHVWIMGSTRCKIMLQVKVNKMRL